MEMAFWILSPTVTKCDRTVNALRGKFICNLQWRKLICKWNWNYPDPSQD